jgi:hypothetical protein
MVEERGAHYRLLQIGLGAIAWTDFEIATEPSPENPRIQFVLHK